LKKQEEVMKRYTVMLSKEEREELLKITTSGKHQSQRVINALILLNTDEGEYQENRTMNSMLSEVLKISERKIDRVKKRFIEEGFEIGLKGRDSTRCYEKKIDGDFEAHLIALSCGETPEGYARWTLRLLADKDEVSHETIRQVLKKTNLSHGKRNVG
jgi:hypothetical protein